MVKEEQPKTLKIKDTDHRQTPRWLKGMFDDWFDPCPYNLNPTIDGLSIDWKDRTYVNPPYSNIRTWVLKAIEEAKKGKRIIMLLPADTSTRYYADIKSCGARVFYSEGRIKFMGYKYPAWGSMLVFFNIKEEDLKDE